MYSKLTIDNEQTEQYSQTNPSANERTTLLSRSDAVGPIDDDAVTRAKIFPLAVAAYSDDPAQCVKNTFRTNATVGTSGNQLEFC